MKKLGLFLFCIVIAAVCVVTGHTEAGISFAAAPGVAVSRDRALWNYLMKEYPNSVPSPSYLRVEQTLSNSKGVYDFRLKRTNTEAITEKKLDQNDLFVITDLAVYLLKEDTSKVGLGTLQTYPNQTVFASATGFTPGHLETIYSGFLSLKVGQKVNIENLSMQEFRIVPTTQQASATTFSESSARLAKYAPDNLIKLNGDMDNIFTIDFPTFSGMQIAAVAANTNNKLVLHPYGYLIRNIK